MTESDGVLALLIPLLVFLGPLIVAGAIAEAVQGWRRAHPRRDDRRPPTQRPPFGRGF